MKQYDDPATPIGAFSVFLLVILILVLAVGLLMAFPQAPLG